MMNKNNHSSIGLPDFLIIGTQKGGSSSLYYYLITHPDIQPATRKELHFFNKAKRYNKGIDWYKKQFPSSKSSNQNKLTGEATPNYLCDPLAPERIAHDLPKTTKFIVLLRNPVDRAYSNYQMKVKKGHEHRSFEEAIILDEKQLKGEFQHIKSKKSEQKIYPYVTRGIYVKQLKTWMNLFPRDQFLIIKSEDLFKNPQKVMNQVFQFLNLKNNEIKKFKVYNSRKYKPMDPSTRKILVEYFKPYNQCLYQFLEKDFGWDQ